MLGLRDRAFAIGRGRGIADCAASKKAPPPPDACKRTGSLPEEDDQRCGQGKVMTVRTGAAFITLAILTGCGPSLGPNSTTDGDGPDSDSAAATAGTAPTSPSPGTDTPSGSSGESSDGGDVPSAGTDPLEDAPMYARCESNEECLPGLTCTPVGLLDGDAFAMCTAECSDPTRDCDAPPAGWTAVCNGFLHMPPDPFCAIGCDQDGQCPRGMTCGEESPFAPPYYCIPT
jgi:hypothetical protein